MFYFKKKKKATCGTVGFLVSKNLKSNLIKTISFSDRVAMLTVNRFNLHNAEIFKVHVPTGTCEDQVIEKFNDNVV